MDAKAVKETLKFIDDNVFELDEQSIENVISILHKSLIGSGLATRHIILYETLVQYELLQGG